MLSFNRKVLKNALSLPEQHDLLRQAGAGLKLRSYPDVLVSGEAQGPMLIGFMKPMIILPGADLQPAGIIADTAS